jgi:hypothetical protein
VLRPWGWEGRAERIAAHAAAAAELAAKRVALPSFSDAMNEVKGPLKFLNPEATKPIARQGQAPGAYTRPLFSST